jgi:hypothetical protein
MACCKETLLNGFNFQLEAKKLFFSQEYYTQKM